MSSKVVCQHPALIATILALALAPAPDSVANAQDGIADLQLPTWAQSSWRPFAQARHLALSTRVNPFVWRGDFDGDGRADLALLVVEVERQREGIAFILRGAEPVLVGAGIEFGNGGDDFSWMDYWYVEDLGAGRRRDAERTGLGTIDTVVVGSESSASARIVFREGRPAWVQAGD
jgi:hypothetical protein